MIGSEIAVAVKFLNQNLPVAIPTETVYGLGGNALNEQAVTAIFAAKNRPFFDPLIIHVASIEGAKQYVKNLEGNALKLAEAFWPGPLTLLLYKEDIIPYLVTSGSDKVAVRVPNQPMTLELLAQLNYPLAAPSANPFGYISPTTAQHVEAQLGAKIPYILDGGECGVGIESTIVDCTEAIPQILRLGGLSISAIENVLGVKPTMALNNNSNPSAPGQLDKHYSPNKKILIVENLEEAILQYANQKMGVLSFGANHIPSDILNYNLSQTAEIDEAARNLFNYLRQLDSSDCDLILVKLLPNEGLGLAINDRLQRAAAK
jgi:L-threonylcarbamoyladenylate synthase